MDTVICKELIVATVERRGKGTQHSPIRIITKVYEKDGTEIAENDPSPETFAPLDLVHFAGYVLDKKIKYEQVTINTVHDWLDSIKNPQQ